MKKKKKDKEARRKRHDLRIRIQMSAAFSSEITDDRKKWHNTFKVLKEKHSQLRILYLAKIPFKNKDTDTLRGKKTKENSQPADGSKRITKGSSSDRRKKKNTRNLEYQKQQQLQISGYKYILDYFPLIFKIYLADESKICNILQQGFQGIY